MNVEFYGIRLLRCVVETMRDHGLELLWSARHKRGSDEEVVERGGSIWSQGAANDEYKNGVSV